MKLINLNIWGGKIHDPLIDFMNKHKDDTNIFCFQEVYKSDRNQLTHGYRSNILGEISDILTDFEYYYYPMASGRDAEAKVDFPLSIGQAIFVKKPLKIKDSGYIFVYLKENEFGGILPNGKAIFPRNFIYTEIEENGKRFLVINLHGFWEPKAKYDTPQRFAQSQIILNFIQKQNLPTILAGDFNLSLNTRSVLMLEEKLKNLVKDYSLPTTRSGLYDPYYGATDKFADYIFTSREIEVLNFEALNDPISDHLPLSLDFEV